MKLKNITTLLLTGIITLSGSCFAFASSDVVPVAPEKNDYINKVISVDDSTSVESVVNKTVTKSLSSTSFTPIVSVNNWLNSRVYITLENDSEVSEALIYVSSTLNGVSTILKEHYLERGESTHFTVPWNEGIWTLYAKTYNDSGDTTFHIQDDVYKINWYFIGLFTVIFTITCILAVFIIKNKKRSSLN